MENVRNRFFAHGKAVDHHEAEAVALDGQRAFLFELLQQLLGEGPPFCDAETLQFAKVTRHGGAGVGGESGAADTVFAVAGRSDFAGRRAADDPDAGKEAFQFGPEHVEIVRTGAEENDKGYFPFHDLFVKFRGGFPRILAACVCGTDRSGIVTMLHGHSSAELLGSSYDRSFLLSKGLNSGNNLGFSATHIYGDGLNVEREKNLRKSIAFYDRTPTAARDAPATQ